MLASTLEDTDVVRSCAFVEVAVCVVDKRTDLVEVVVVVVADVCEVETVDDAVLLPAGVVDVPFVLSMEVLLPGLRVDVVDEARCADVVLPGFLVVV